MSSFTPLGANSVSISESQPYLYRSPTERTASTVS